MTSNHVRRLESRVAQTAARLVEYATREQLDVADLPGTRLPWYAVRNQADEPDTATVYLFDEIGGSLGVQADQFVQDLDAIDAAVIHLRINSPGGSLFDAIAMHSALLHHPARVISYVDSLAASAASVVAMAGDEIVMMPGSQMMIHDASAVQDGNAAEMARMSTFLDRQSGNVADLYRQKAGGDADEWRELMLAETWMFADEAVAFGLADRVQERPAPVPDPELTEAMARAFDLAGRYRYASRRQAPAPPGRRAMTTRVAAKVRKESTTMTQLSTDAQRLAAAQRRGSAAGRQPGGRTLAMRRGPTGLSTARMGAFPAQFRAELVTHNGQQRYHLVGHASVTEVLYEMWDEHGPYKEGLRRYAFDKTLAADPDVAFLVNHRGVTMARTTNGSLKLGMDQVGFAMDAWLNPKRQDVSDLVVAVDDKDITEMSFAFMLDDEHGGTWSRDFTEFWIEEVDIDRGDVSAVNYGANPYTDVAARSREVLADLDHLPAGAARAAVVRLRARPDLDGLFDEYDKARQVAGKAEGHSLGIVPPASVRRAPVGRSISHIEALLLDD